MKNKNKKVIKISRRERECLALLVSGHEVKQIAQLLSLKAETIRTYLNRLKEKLEANSLSEAIKKACKAEII